jgi:hypothetical protein
VDFRFGKTKAESMAEVDLCFVRFGTSQLPMRMDKIHGDGLGIGVGELIGFIRSERSA